MSSRRPLLLALSLLFGSSCLVATGGLGCGLWGSAGPSTVGQGKLYHSGEARFDELFSQLFELQRELAHPEEDHAALLQPVQRALELPTTASSEASYQALEARLQALHARGVRLERSPASAPTSDAVFTVHGAAPSEADAALLTALRAYGLGLQALEARRRRDELTLARLRRHVAELRPTVDSAFRASWRRRREVHDNLDDAEQLFPILEARSREALAALRAHLERVQRLLAPATPPVAAPPSSGAAERREAAAPATPARRTAPRSAPATRPASRPPAPPRPRPAPDFEP